MNCPKCGFTDSSVLETRAQRGGAVVLRRRRCRRCQSRFKTLEKLDVSCLLVRKKDLSKEIFDLNKLRQGIVLACRKRPVDQSRINHLVEEIEAKILMTGTDTVSSQLIGEVAMESLKKLDKVAYLRYASVCCGFDDVDNFEQEVKKLKNK
ncbi:MAG: transcriptional regulator NrdR [Patescibacteria group bacterium]